MRTRPIIYTGTCGFCGRITTHRTRFGGQLTWLVHSTWQHPWWLWAVLSGQKRAYLQCHLQRLPETDRQDHPAPGERTS